MSCNAALRIRGLDDSTDWRARLFVPSFDPAARGLPQYTLNPGRTVFRAYFACRTNHAFTQVSARTVFASPDCSSEKVQGFDEDLRQGHIKFTNEHELQHISNGSTSYVRDKSGDYTDSNDMPSVEEFWPSIEKQSTRGENDPYDDQDEVSWHGILRGDGENDDAEEEMDGDMETWKGIEKKQGCYDCKCKLAVSNGSRSSLHNSPIFLILYMTTDRDHVRAVRQGHL